MSPDREALIETVFAAAFTDFLTQKAFADAIQANPSNLITMRAGRRPIPLKTWLKLCALSQLYPKGEEGVAKACVHWVQIRAPDADAAALAAGDLSAILSSH